MSEHNHVIGYITVFYSGVRSNYDIIAHMTVAYYRRVCTHLYIFPYDWINPPIVSYSTALAERKSFSI